MAEERPQDKIAELKRDLIQSHMHDRQPGSFLEKKLNELYILYHVERTIGTLLVLYGILFQVMNITKESLFESL